MGSASELDCELLIARDLGFVRSERYEALSRELRSIKAMLSTLIEKSSPTIHAHKKVSHTGSITPWSDLLLPFAYCLLPLAYCPSPQMLQQCDLRPRGISILQAHNANASLAALVADLDESAARRNAHRHLRDN
ncbi:MAG: hypothetical protein DMG62_09150 [Acidobacteria bacterium]|nr:MAG: hypothetical protein DMG63_07710 [Acidobacteriota bacterium]PYY23250.1 MAG: hypothetical protein DMG62_09150 [Acidobacteriota bacterium]